MLPIKLSFFALIAVIISLIIYLNRSYAHIYSNNQNIQNSVFQSAYKIGGGKGVKEIKYAALGDSLTYGTGASDYKYSFPYIFAQKLLEKNKRVEVVNLAVSGATSEDVILYQVAQAIEENPDFISLMIGTNDVHNFVTPESFRTNVLEIIEKLLSGTKAKILLINIPYLGANNLILFPHNYVLDQKIKDFNEIILEAATSKNIKHFDLYSSSKEEFKNDSTFYSSDNFHPSDKGYRLWGNLINAD